MAPLRFTAGYCLRLRFRRDHPIGAYRASGRRRGRSDRGGGRRAAGDGGAEGVQPAGAHGEHHDHGDSGEREWEYLAFEPHDRDRWNGAIHLDPRDQGGHPDAHRESRRDSAGDRESHRDGESRAGRSDRSRERGGPARRGRSRRHGTAGGPGYRPLPESDLRGRDQLSTRSGRLGTHRHQPAHRRRRKSHPGELDYWNGCRELYRAGLPAQWEFRGVRGQGHSGDADPTRRERPERECGNRGPAGSGRAGRAR